MDRSIRLLAGLLAVLAAGLFTGCCCDECNPSERHYAPGGCPPKFGWDNQSTPLPR